MQKDVDGMMAMALFDPDFARMLLDPEDRGLAIAIAKDKLPGLTDEEIDTIKSIEAKNLEEFAGQCIDIGSDKIKRRGSSLG